MVFNPRFFQTQLGYVLEVVARAVLIFHTFLRCGHSPQEAQVTLFNGLVPNTAISFRFQVAQIAV